MIEGFSVENFLSFRDKVSISFKAGAIKEFKEENTFKPVYKSDDALLKSIGVFGANGSGKSNLLKALGFMKYFVLNSSKESNSNESIPVKPFLLSTVSNMKSSTFEVIFYVKEDKFRYGFSVDSKQVNSEWLFSFIKNKEEKIFIRAEQNYTFGKEFREGIKNKQQIFTEFTRPNALFASVLSQFNDPLLLTITNWFDDIFIAPDISHIGLVDFTANIMSQGDYRRLINNIIINSDLGIEGIQEYIKEQSSGLPNFKDFIKNLSYEKDPTYKVLTKHNVFDEGNNLKDIVFFDLVQNESLGTQKFFGILGPILWALKQRKILMIDEIDSRLHNLLVEQIITLFNSNKFNPNGAQLLFTSHNTNLLRKSLRRDQIILTEKNNVGACKIDSLYSKDPKVRSDASFNKDYLLGKYGAIPKLNTQLNLFDAEDAM